MQVTIDPEDRCTEVLADGTIYTFSISKSADQAHAVLDQLAELDGQELDFDFTAAVFSLFVSSIHILHESGWTVAELVAQVHDHTASEPEPD